MSPAADFTAHAHPVLAVTCPTCHAKAGLWCVRPSEHRAAELHHARRQAADRVFIGQHGEGASIERTANGWQIDPSGRSRARRRITPKEQAAFDF